MHAAEAVPWLRRLVAVFTSLMSGFDQVQLMWEFVVDKVIL
jgi:hypothetical protein